MVQIVFIFYYTEPADLLKSTIVSIPKIKRYRFQVQKSIEVYHFLIRSVNYLTIFFHLNTVNSFNSMTCNLTTTLCTFIYKEVIGRFINYDSTVYRCVKCI